MIEGLHLRGVEFRSLAEDFDTATANGKLQFSMVLAFSEWWRNSIRDRSVAWTLRISSGVSKGIYESVVQSGRDFPYIGVGGGQ